MCCYPTASLCDLQRKLLLAILVYVEAQTSSGGLNYWFRRASVELSGLNSSATFVMGRFRMV